MEDFNCPDCSAKLNEISGCGSVSYFCSECKKLISRSKMKSRDKQNNEEG